MNLSPEHEVKLQEAFSRHIGRVMAAQEMMDEKQIFDCFVQALKVGDFVKHCRPTRYPNPETMEITQGFIYQPYREAEQLREKYHELIYAVVRKFPDETRHETALRYIKEAEARHDKGNDSCEFQDFGG